MRSQLLYAPVVILATACGGSAGLEEGNAPESLKVYLDGSADSAQGVECGAGSLAAVLSFTDGSNADYVNRVTWRSSDTAVAEISNGEIQAPSGGYYSTGTVLYHRPGVATLTADYLDMTASVAVEVIELDRLEITPDNTLMGPDTNISYELKGYTATGYPASNLGVSVDWSFLEDGAPADVLGDSTSASVTISSLNSPLDTPFVLQAELPLCDRDVQRSITIAQPERLVLTSEQGGTNPLPLLAVEALKVYAEFSDGSRQNLSGQLDIEQIAGNDDDAELAASGSSGNDDDLLLLTPSNADETVAYELCHEEIDLCIDTDTYTLSDIELQSIRADPLELSLTYPDEAYLKAWGTFADGIERDVTRIVSWSSNNASLASVTTGTSDGGHVTSLNGDGEAQITVSDDDATGTSEDLIDISVYSIVP